MSEYVTKKDLFLISSIICVMLGFLVYGYFLLKSPVVENCWSKYTTEREAIENCEGVNQ